MNLEPNRALAIDASLTTIMRTYYNLTVAMAVNFIGYVNRTTSVLCHSNFPFLVRFELPDGVLVLGMLLQLFGCHGCHLSGKRFAFAERRTDYSTLGSVQDQESGGAKL